MSNLSDPIADFLTRLRNAARSHRGDVAAPYSRLKEEIARILKQEGYISEFEIDTETNDCRRQEADLGLEIRSCFHRLSWSGSPKQANFGAMEPRQRMGRLRF